MTYKIIQYCRMCKVRFVLMKGEQRTNYCVACLKRMRAGTKDK